jgi:hypothetical protein
MLENFDFNKIINSPEIIEVNRLVETFHIVYHRAPNDIKIDIFEHNNNCFSGICNYGIWGPDQADAYKSIHLKHSVVEALNNALEGIQAFDSAVIPNELLFWVADDDTIFDGNGEKITLEEAQRRRANNKESFNKVPWTQTLMNGGPWWLISKNFDSKEFSIIGPIDDDTEYVYKVKEIRDKGIDFRMETVPINKQTKDELIIYFEKELKLRLVSHEEIYKT